MDKKMNDKKRIKILDVIMFLLVFVTFFVFYRSYPLYIYNMDDWSFIGYNRHPIPSLTAFNPIKVVPETFFPFMSLIGARVINLVRGNGFIENMAVSFAICVSFFIAIYFYMYYLLFKARFRLNRVCAIILTVINILIHFLIYVPTKSDTNTIPYFFYSYDVNCIFNYVIPFLMNSTVVMYYIRNGSLFRKEENSRIHNGVIFLVIYLCIASNMYQNGILIVWIGTELLFVFFESFSGNKKSEDRRLTVTSKVVKYFKDNITNIIIVMFWIICCILESHGRRAQSSSNGMNVIGSFKTFISSIRSFNMFFLVGSACVCIVFIGVLIIKFRRGTIESKDIDILVLVLKEGIAFFVMIIYLILLSAKVGKGLERQDVICCWLWYLILMAFTMAYYIIRDMQWIIMLFPIIIYFLVFETVIDGKRYMQVNNTGNVDVKTAKVVDEYIIEQVLEAQDNGLDAVEVHVPYYNDGDNWPMATYGGGMVSNSLFSLGVTHKRMNITIVPDIAVNDMFNISR